MFEALLFSAGAVVDGLGALPTSLVCSPGDGALSAFGIGLETTSDTFKPGDGDRAVSAPARGPDAGSKTKTHVKHGNHPENNKIRIKLRPGGRLKMLERRMTIL